MPLLNHNASTFTNCNYFQQKAIVVHYLSKLSKYQLLLNMPFHLSPIAMTNTSGNLLQQHASTIACNTPPPLSTLKFSRFNASTYTHFPKHTKQTLIFVNLTNHFVKNVINVKLMEMNCGKGRTINFIILDFLTILYGSMIVVGKYVVDMAPIDLASLRSCSTLVFFLPKL